MENLTPRQIVQELDKYIIGQNEAKKMVAIALRNRYRRNLVRDEIREDIIPKNILMIGPTGVGKTEIARRLAKMIKAPFVKVEATKFTEVGYVGRDVDSIVRDLIEESVRLVKEEKIAEVAVNSREAAKDRVVEILAPSKNKKGESKNPFEFLLGFQTEKNEDKEEEKDDDSELRRRQIREQIDNGLLDEMMVEIEVEDTTNTPLEVLSGGNAEEINFNISDVFGNMFPKKKKNRKVSVKDAIKYFEQEESSKLIDMDEDYREARRRAEEDGIIFIDEIDKIAAKGSTHGPDVSREGVQRDILPIVEGSTVNTKYGPVKTDYMLFIAAGAFHVSSVSDLIPELQGRFPVRVELKSLSVDDFKQILLKPKNALIKQYIELLKTEDVSLSFTEDSIEAFADAAYKMNQQSEDIGARRLHTVLEQILMDILFEAPEIDNKNMIIDKKYIMDKIKDLYKEIYTNKYII